VVEQVDVPFRSTVTTDYLGKKVGVMHACGHDAHIRGAHGVAEALASLRGDLPGTVLFVFQPAEEGAPQGEEGGALKEGRFAAAKPEAIFASTSSPARPAADQLPVRSIHGGRRISSAFEVTGRQTHVRGPGWAWIRSLPPRKLTILPGSNPVLVNDPELTERMLPSLRRVVGADRVQVAPLQTGAEDFAYCHRRAGARVATRALLAVTVDYMQGH
jgi:metal-dependent amidase/aminoacylase/carboxypeptidase family protein